MILQPFCFPLMPLL